MAIELRILGTRELLDDRGQAITAVLAQPKRFALLVYLALDSPLGTHSRDALLAMFWPEHSSDSARNSLTQALSFLRRALGPRAIVNIGRGAVRLEHSLMRCDASDVRASMDRGDHARAVETYRGPLLSGFFVSGAPEFECWLEGQRAQLHAATVKGASTLVAQERLGGNYARAIHWAEVAVQLEPCAEQTVRALMELCVASGDRIRAKRAFDMHAAALRAELDVGPSQALVELRASIRLAGDRPISILADSESSIGEHVPADEALAVHTPGLPKSVLRPLGWAAGIAVAGIAAVATFITRPPDVSTSVETRAQLSLVFDDSVRLRSDMPGSLLAIDPAGTRIAYVGGTSPERIYVRSLKDPTPRAVAGSENARMPQFTANGRAVAFRVGRVIRVASLDGGPVRTLVDSANRFSLASDGSVVYESTVGMADGGLRIAFRSGVDRSLTKPDKARGENTHVHPHVTPDGKHVLFVIYCPKPESSELALVRIADGSIIRLGIDGVSPRFVRPRFLVFGRRNGQLMGVRFDPVAGRVIGLPVALLSDVRVFERGDMQLALSESGTLVYLPSDRSRQIALLDPVRRTSEILTGPAELSSPRVSPDGRLIAVTIGDRKAQDVWILDIATRALSRFTWDGMSSGPQWTPDGRSLQWLKTVSPNPEMWRQLRDQTEPAQRLISGVWTARLSPSSEQLVVLQNGQGVQHDRVGDHVRIMERDSALTWQTTTRLQGTRPILSSSGRLLAYQHEGIQVRELASPYRTLRVSRPGSLDPVWNGERELFYREDGNVVSVTLDWGARPGVVATRRVAGDQFWSRAIGSPHYDVMPDGKRIVVVQPVGSANQPTVIFNWATGLRERLGHVAQR